MAATHSTDALLQGIAPDSPAGPDLSYDAAFMELERIAQGSPQSRVVGPDGRPDETDWRAVREQAFALLLRSKDLRVGAVLTKAWLRTDGLSGLRDGTDVLLGLLTGFWATVHPGISEEDGGPTMRVNTLKELCEPGLLTTLRTAPLVSVPGLGSVSLRDIAIATGELAPVAGAGAGGASLDMPKIDAAFANCELEPLQAAAANARKALANVLEIQRYVAEQVGAQYGLDLEPLATPLKRIDKLLGERLAVRERVKGGNGVSTASTGGAAELRSLGGEIASRADVVQVLDTVCAYYERHEPASPVPLLLRRAQRLVPMSFMEVVRELAPAGVTEIETIRGPQDPEKK